MNVFKNLLSFLSFIYLTPCVVLAQPTFSPPIDIESIGATTIFTEDLDNDGDIDIATFEGGKHNSGAKVFARYENEGNDVWTKHDFHSSIWSQNNGLFGLYSPADLDMDGDISASDNVLWSRNNGLFSTVED